MPDALFYDTVTPALRKILTELMAAPEFFEFRLVGGTSLSLQKGHRLSVDIDLFTDADYNSIDFNAIDSFLRKKYPYVDTTHTGEDEVGWGTSCFIGDSEGQSIKLDLYYTDKFIRPIKEIDGIRLATVEEIIAMKMDIVSRGGRKKDFWDIHEVMENFSLNDMLALHEERYPFGDNRDQIISNLTSFENADGDFQPICLRDKHWEVIKLDMIDFAKT